MGIFVGISMGIFAVGFAPVAYILAADPIKVCHHTRGAKDPAIFVGDAAI